jgi:hypothetical protein
MSNPPSRTHVAVIVVLALLACAMLSCGGPMQPEELARSVDTLSSAAAEGSLLGNEVARQHSKDTFIRVRATELADDAEHEAQKVADSTPSAGIAAKKQAAVRLGGDISQALGGLQTKPGDPNVGRQTARRLDALRKRADALSQSL